MNDSFDEKPEPFYMRFGHGFRLWLLIALYIACGMILIGLSSYEPFAFLRIDLTQSDSMNMVRLAYIFNSMVFLIPALLFANVFPENRFEWLQVRQAPPQRLIFPLLLLAIGATFFTELLAEVNIYLMKDTALRAADIISENETEKLLQMPVMTDLFANIFVFAFIPAVCEELFFRGAMQQILGDWTRNKHIAIFITAGIFTLMHLHFSGLIPRFVMGLALGYVFLWSGSLQLSMLLHFLYNGIEIMFVHHAQQYPQSKVLVYGETVAAGIAGGALMVLGLFLLYRKAVQTKVEHTSTV
ncbi:MAG: CPBP family glutamic-type intramembrane protease [Bacteroidia bacterium]